MARRSWKALATVALALLAGRCAGPVACTSATSVRARTEGFNAADATLAHRRTSHRHARERVEVRCPVAVDDPGLVLATVGDATITACDLVIAREHRARAGLAAEDPRATLRTLVDEALLAAEAPTRAPHIEPAVERTLADALVRAEATEAVNQRRPTERELDRWLNEHPESRVRDARVHLRQLVFGSELEAREAIRALRAGTPFEDLLERSIDPLARRDQGDLGLLTTEGATGVLPAVVTVGFALTEAGQVADDPVEGFTRQPSSRSRRSRRGRAPSGARWHVVQLLERIAEEQIDDGAVRARAAERILRDRYATERSRVRERLATELSPRVHGAIDLSAAASVRVRSE